MDARARRDFDRILEQVLDAQPPLVHQLIERIPLHVEDYPSDRVMAEMGVRRRDQLCGLFSGISLKNRSVQHSGALPDVVTLYREGILAASIDFRGRVDPDRLREEIRITLLHELAHFHGLDEEELRELEYG